MTATTAPSDERVLAAVRAHWSAEVDRLEPLDADPATGRRWTAHVGYRPALRVAHRPVDAPAEAADLEATSGAVAELAFSCDFVVAGLATDDLRHTVRAGDGVLTVTPWVMGEPAADAPGEEPAAFERAWSMVLRLHAVRPPRGALSWTPIDDAAVLHRLEALLDRPWDLGPLGAQAREVLADHAGLVRELAATHRALVERVGAGDPATWVATHGAPTAAHQLLTVVRPLLTGWTGLRRAPRERDLAALVHDGHAEQVAALADETGGPDPTLLALFALERRLDDLRRHAVRLAGPHPGSPHDVAALAALRADLGS